MSNVSLDAHAACIPASQLLFDWREGEHKARFPVTFAVERESARVWSMRFVPVGPAQLAPSLRIAAGDRLLLLSGGGPTAVYAPRLRRGVPLVPATLLPRLRAPVELVHVPRGFASRIAFDEIPTSLLADPEAALPMGWASRFALSIQDGCHGVVYTTDPELLRSCLRSFLQAYQHGVLGADIALPPMPDRLLEPLMVPRAPDTYVEVSFDPGSRFWSMEHCVLEAGSENPVQEPVRWVCEGAGGSWRVGWSW
ncbi:MAG: hypothetical protein ABIO70_20195 [Pseudomonadota bacterium]